MSLADYSADRLLVYYDGYRITEWGAGDPLTMEPVRDKFTINFGYGSAGTMSGVTKQGSRLKLNIMPGSKDAKEVNTLNQQLRTHEVEIQVIGTTETHILSDGVYKTYGARVRGGEKPSDDEFNLEFLTDYSSLGSD